MAYGFENKYPYTDFHELNLDWILENVKRIAEENKVISADIERLDAEYKTFEDFYDALMSGDFPDGFKIALSEWLQENALDLFGQLVKFVFFGLTQDGYFVAFIPDSWSDIQFGTSGYDDFPAGVDYGHLTLSY